MSRCGTKGDDEMNINTNYNNPVSGYDIAGVGVQKPAVAEKTTDLNDIAALRFSEVRDTVVNELGLPELDDVNLSAIEGMESKLEVFSNKLTDSLVSVGGKKVMFDIYALMSIIQEMSQRLRNAMREVRQLENQSIQANLRQQAEVQRTAATTAAIAGAVLCTVQGVVTAALTVGSLKQMSSQNQVMEQNGVGVYDKQSRMAQAVSDQEAASLQYQKIVGKNPELAVETTMANYDAANENVSLVQGKVNTAQEQLTQAQQEAAAAHADLDAKEQIQQIASGELKNRPDGGQYTMRDRINAMDKLSQGLENRVSAADAKLANATQKLEAAQAELKTAKDAVPVALQKDMDAYAAKFDAVRSRANVELEQNGKLSAATKADLKKAEGQLEIARAKQVNTVATLRAQGNLPASVESDVKASADMRYAQATSKSQSGLEATKNQRSIMKLQMVQTLNMTIGQYGQQLVSSLQQFMAAEAVELQAEQKMTEDQLDQIKDLMQQQLSVIQKTFELFASVVSKESQTIEGIIRA